MEYNYSPSYLVHPVSASNLTPCFLSCCQKAFTIMIFHASQQSEGNLTSWCYCIIFAYWLLYLCPSCFLACLLQKAYFLVSLSLTTVVGALSHWKLTPAQFFFPLLLNLPCCIEESRNADFQRLSRPQASEDMLDPRLCTCVEIVVISPQILSFISCR